MFNGLVLAALTCPVEMLHTKADIYEPLQRISTKK